MSPDAVGSNDVFVKFADMGIGAVGKIAISENQGETPGATVGALRAALEDGTLTNLQDSGVGTNADHSV